MWRKLSLPTAVLLATMATQAQAALVISPTGPTTNVSCVSHVCTATAANAVLAVSRVRRLLASGSVKVATGSAANDIEIDAAFGWTSASTLTLDAQHSIAVNNPVTVSGPGGLTIITNDGGTGGTLLFAKPGRVNFWSLSSSLTINGNAYTLVNNIATLASHIASNPSGFYALAANYDATPDGVYTTTPISTEFTGVLKGLGNTISYLKVHTPRPGGEAALFYRISGGGAVAGLGLTHVDIRGEQIGGIVAEFVSGLLFNDFVTGALTINGNGNGEAGGLALTNSQDATIDRSYSAANVSGNHSTLGGLVAASSGPITNSYATGSVTGGNSARVGGLVGKAQAMVLSKSYSTGKVAGGDWVIAGGLVGESGGVGTANIVSDSYATGSVTGGQHASVGGFVGRNDTGSGTVNSFADSYSTGSIVGGAGSSIGGFVGKDFGTDNFSDCYWDTTTSGITDLSQGAGNVANDPGITGLTTAQLQSGLPAGFSASIWGENSGINGGLPYLLSIPPE